MSVPYMCGVCRAYRSAEVLNPQFTHPPTHLSLTLHVWQPLFLLNSLKLPPVYANTPHPGLTFTCSIDAVTCCT